MKFRMIKKIIGGLFLGVLCMFIYFTYYAHFEDKPHFREKHTQDLYVLQELDIGVTRPVFNISLFKAYNRSQHGRRTINSLSNYKRQKLRDKAPRISDKKLERMMRDELPLLAPDWNCSETYSTFQTESYCLPHHNVSTFFLDIKNSRCLKEGTSYVIKNNTACYCKPRWHGQYCSMPEAIHKSEFPRDTYAHRVSIPPRRLINAFPFTQEFHLLEARLHDYKDVIDLYVILESNYTAAGFPRKRLLLKRLKEGYLKEFQHKILYVPLGYFPHNARYNGWIVDALLRNHIASEGLTRIKNLRESDIIVLNDADEMPVREGLQFLKLHRGYPEPIGFYLVHNVFGFYWIGNDFLSHAFGACSIGMLLHFFDWKLYNLRSATAEMNTNKPALDHFRYIHGGAVQQWSFGKKASLMPGGWHCSWCFDPKGIKTKLEGAHWSDLPRWGAMPSKTTQDYLRNLTIKGLWFDDRTALLPAPPRTDDWFAPPYFKSNLEEYEYLLIKPSLL